MTMNSNMPATAAVAITPSDSTNFAVCRAIYVGGAGNIVAVVNGVAVTFSNALAGSVIPIRATRVNSTNTTATGLVALY
jgi:hypothetical protein